MPGFFFLFSFFPSNLNSSNASALKQAGGEVTDFIIVLRTSKAVETFSGNVHFSVGAGLSAAVGIVGRAAEADIRAGDGGYAACYTYSCSKGTIVSPPPFFFALIPVTGKVSLLHCIFASC